MNEYLKQRYSFTTSILYLNNFIPSHVDLFTVVHQFNIFILSFGALQGALLSFFLLRKREGDKARMFFAIFLAVVGLQLTFKVIAKSWLWHNVNLMYLLSYSLPLLIGPALYLFIRSRQNVPLTWIDVLHVLPFILN